MTATGAVPACAAYPPDWFMLATLMFEKDDGA